MAKPGELQVFLVVRYAVYAIGSSTSKNFSKPLVSLRRNNPKRFTHWEGKLMNVNVNANN